MRRKALNVQEDEPLDVQGLTRYLLDAWDQQFDALINADLALLWDIQDFIYKRPWLDSRLARVVSKHPWRDVCMVIWLFAALGVYQVGWHHFWMVTLNLGMSFAARKLIRAKRPVEYDERLQPMADLGGDSFGFPSLESYMSVIIMMHFTWHTSLWMLPLSLFVIGIVGFSRVYVRSRFPHQVVGSWLLGFLGLAVGGECCNRMKFHEMNRHQHYTCITLAFVLVAINFGLAIEGNESRLVYIPKKEFLRVLVDIVNGGGDRGERVEDESIDADAAFEDTRAPPSLSNTLLSPRAAELLRTKLNQARARFTSGKQPKRDSFYFLQRSLEERDRKLTTGSTINPLSLFTAPSGAESDHEHIA